MDALSASGHITQKAFSFHLDSRSHSNYVDFGPPKADSLAPNESIKYVHADKSFFWGRTPEGVRFGPTGEGFYLSEQAPAIFSTATKINLVP